MLCSTYITDTNVDTCVLNSCSSYFPLPDEVLSRRTQIIGTKAPADIVSENTGNSTTTKAGRGRSRGRGSGRGNGRAKAKAKSKAAGQLEEELEEKSKDDSTGKAKCDGKREGKSCKGKVVGKRTGGEKDRTGDEGKGKGKGGKINGDGKGDGKSCKRKVVGKRTGGEEDLTGGKGKGKGGKINGDGKGDNDQVKDKDRKVKCKDSKVKDVDKNKVEEMNLPGVDVKWKRAMVTERARAMAIVSEAPEEPGGTKKRRIGDPADHANDSNWPGGADFVYPKTFARRFCPKVTATSNLWKLRARCFYVYLNPSLQPGMKTRMEAWL
jgi:hypothetical protein